MEQQKHFVLVHNAFHGAWIWYKLKPMLEAAGHKVTAMDLTASGIDPRPIEQTGSFDDYSKPLLDLIGSDLLSEGEKVVIVGLSLGGISAAFAADKFPQKVGLIVFVNAFMPDIQHTPSYVLDKFMEIPKDWKDCKFSSYESNNGIISTATMGHQFLKEFLYQECPIEDYELAKMLTKKGSFFQEDLAKHEKLTKEGYGSIKRVYIIGEEDKIILKEFMKWEINNFGVEKTYIIPGGDHMLTLSKPQSLLACLLEIATNYA